ncbi:hypothetical protein ACLB1E_34125 [Escherichia coli]
MQQFPAPEGYAYIQDISTIAATSLRIKNTSRVFQAKISTMSIPSESLSGKGVINRLTDNLSKQVKAAYELSHSQAQLGR